MPLEMLSDHFDTTTHKELDKAVNADVSDDISDALASLSEFGDLLVSIVNHSKDHLNQKYGVIKEAKTLIKTHKELQDMLTSAWKHRSYRDIRNIAILQTPASMSGLSADSTRTEIKYQDFRDAFEAKYHGAAVDGFYEYLTYNEKCFRTLPGGVPRYYAKFCSIVQSSGTGKSRMLTELAKKDVIVIYMNLREEGDNVGFPPRDPVPSNILTRFPGVVEDYQTVCYAFLTALFHTVEGYLTSYNSISDAREWVGQMCDMSRPTGSSTRAAFFQKLAAEYQQVHAELSRFARQHQSGSSRASEPLGTDAAGMANTTTEVDVEKTANAFQGLSLSESRPHPLAPTSFVGNLSDAYKKVGVILKRIFPDAHYEPKLVIAMDEAHPLSAIVHGYRPADVFCRAVSDYTHAENHALWVVFASTTSKVADFSPPNQKYNSARVADQGQQLFPPYTQLGWDQNASALGDFGMEDIAKLDHIIGYGRPLWLSLKTAYNHADMVLRVADTKLCGATRFNPADINHVLAVVGQRFAVNITFGHPDSIQHLEKGVASHLRICLATTLDRNWRFTSYPSEPLLSCAAANALHGGPGVLEEALGIFLKSVNSGMIDVGQRGELASRLLWLLAKDLFIRTQAQHVVTNMPSTWEDDFPDCQMIPVVDWLEFVFGPKIWGVHEVQAPLARKVFQNAYLNFSHWICMEKNVAIPDGLSLDHWTRRHWQRSSAVQCCHQQPDIDKVIPIYFKGGLDTVPPESRVSQIFISDKARKSKSSKNVLHDISRRHKSIGGSNSSLDPVSLPYVAILADLGQPSSLSVTFPQRETDDRCLRIYAGGVDATTYPFLANHGGLMKTLQDLVHQQQIPEVVRPYKNYLDAQVQFGSTSAVEHMIWERGKDVPDIPRYSV